MSKNLIPEICKMLGVEIGEKFKIKGDGHTYSIKLDGLHSDQYAMEDDYATLLDLLCGEAEIVKIPWKPTLDEGYWTFTVRDFLESSSRTWTIRPGIWENHPIDIALFNKGWIYRTRAEAEAALPAVAKEIGVEYEL